MQENRQINNLKKLLKLQGWYSSRSIVKFI
jgi:hypothetical protein